jgi:sortase B
MILVFSIGIIYSSYRILTWKKDNNENINIKEEIEEAVEVIEEEEEVKYSIDFNKLKSQNSDTVAYLKVNNTDVDYVVVKGKDNKYYLTHNFEKKWNVAGWVFADYHNKFDGTDRNIVIFGHNMKTGIMFGTLKKVLKKDWYTNPDNSIITLATEAGNYSYQVFSVYSIKPEAYYINTEFKNDSEFYEFLNKVKNRSIYDFNVSLSKEDKILTLSTCNSNGRTVLHAKLLSD